MNHCKALLCLKTEVQHDLTKNILPFWLRMIDEENGGFYGQMSCDGVLDKEAPKGGIYISRILWTFSRAARLIGDEQYLHAAERAYAFLRENLWDNEFGGVFWSADAMGNPLEIHKMSYVQAFAIYGLSEYHRATGSEEALQYAKKLYHLIEEHAADPIHGGYFEGASRDWETIEPMVLGEGDPPAHKSMNTHLHILEAYSNLLLVWDDAGLRDRQRELIRVMTQRIVHPTTKHFQLYFDAEWNSQNDQISYGHDIEGSWLLEEAVRILGDNELIQSVNTLAVEMGAAVFNEGLDKNGIIQWEGDSSGVVDGQKYWWSLAEQVVGFINLYQKTDDPLYLKIVERAWGYIQSRIVDREKGEWIWGVYENGQPIPADKAGIWKGPYHNGRMGFEVIERIQSAGN